MMLTRLTACLGLVLGTAATISCSSQTRTPAPAASAPGPGSLTPVLSVRELMTHIIDPTADWIFDAAVVDISAERTTTTVPTSDEDWLRVERGLLTLAEASNLLKMARPVAPAGERPGAPRERSMGSAELSPADIQARIEADRPRWDQHADQLRTVALASLVSVRKRIPDTLFAVGNDIDTACENCHLAYWYPGDKPAVDRMKDSRVTFDTK